MEAVDYLYYDEASETYKTGTVSEYTSVTAGDYEWETGTYVLDTNVTYGTEETSRRVAVKGDVKLILKDGCTLTANGGIQVSEGNSLTIYAQSEADESEDCNTGKLIAQSMFIKNAGIGGNDEENGGIITIHGGTIEAYGCDIKYNPDYLGDCGAGIGGGNNGNGGTITINGGTIKAHAEYGLDRISANGAAIGGCGSGSGGKITINRGIVIATSQSYGATIGGAGGASAGNITINGGTIKAYNTEGYRGGYGIGGNGNNNEKIIVNGGNIETDGIGQGDEYSTSDNTEIKINDGTIKTYSGIWGKNIIINNGNIDAKSLEYDSGEYIDKNSSAIAVYNSGKITINGGRINAQGGKNGFSGIGGNDITFSGKNEFTIEITGGNIDATGYNGGAGIGRSRNDFSTNNIIITGGTINATVISDNKSSGAGAGIGGGYQSSGGNIIITGGNITATGGDGDQNVRPSSGIGAGAGGTIDSIIISGGVVTATGGGKGDGSYNQAPAIGSYDGTSGTFSTVLPSNGISTFGLLDDASSSRSGNAVVFANGYGSIDCPISDFSQQDSWGGLFFLNGEGMMLGKTVKPTDNFTIPEGYNFTINQLQTLDLADAAVTLEGKIYNNGTILNEQSIFTSGNGEVVNPASENPSVDLTDLNSKLEEAKAAIASGQYTEDSLKELETLIGTIESAENLTADQVTDYISRLQTAMNGLKKPVDTTEIEKVISSFEGRTDLDQYTNESVKAVQDLIDEYQSKTGLTQDEIDEYLSRIQTAIKALQHETDIPAPDDKYYRTYIPAGNFHWSISDEAGNNGTYSTDARYTILDPVSTTDIDSILRETVRSSGVIYLYDYYGNLPNTISAKEFTDAWAKGTVAELMQQAEKKNSGTIEPVTGIGSYSDVRRDVLDEWEAFLDDLGIYKASAAALTTWAEETLENYFYTFYDLKDLDVTVDWSQGDPDIILSTASMDLLNFDQLVEDILEMVSSDWLNDAQSSELVYLMQQYNKYVGDGLLDPDDSDTPIDPGTSGSALVDSMIAYFQSVAASGDYTEASVHRVQALINSIPYTLTDEQARYYADLIYDAVMAMEPKEDSHPVYIEVPVPSGSTGSTGSSAGQASGSSNQTGWVHNINGSVYYKNGKVLTGWQTIDGDRYYFSKQGFMQSGWQVIDGSYYYFSANGVMLTGWQKYDTAWYYLDPDTGKMYAGGFYEIDGKNYYFYDWGGMACNCWIEADNSWYFMGGDGAMKKAGWIQWDGKYYYLTGSGRMAVNTVTPDGYFVGTDGVWNG